MSNRNWVCFSCRITNRKSSRFAGKAICSECGGELNYLGYKIPVPPKSKPKEWKKLQEQLASEAREYERDIFKAKVRNRHDLEQELEKLKALPSNIGRQSLIKQLEKRLKYA
ncbi:hypothetical protein [Litorilituus sediminis]|uniref:Uncharacterized protein n=1 Tax=Litorilituus sediminis TaxID=718192 RepID=A0A4V0ZFN7_9GAMM|nr:hypothetical protein [Litorilituus sediminis]QBG34440.1 hypothetical protein EMK97_01145 [Litorilituus sediminis]